ncbi:MAG: class I SAM-dependent methyltransferase [Patescibacteria group bacterium]|nr:class I SAM-dependent methyltransferase [Patescibacteria group bacterium]MCL5431954.1 class I SAM-dependent methyltransferase [Patescibacteria group bacterium]
MEQTHSETEILDLRSVLSRHGFSQAVAYDSHGGPPLVQYFVDRKEVPEDQLPLLFGYSDAKSFDIDFQRIYKELQVYWLSDASGGIDHYADCLGYSNTEDLINELKGKKILDLGSGRGILAREAYLRHIDCSIISLEPKLSLTGYKENISGLSKEFLKEYQPPKKSVLASLVDRLKGIPQEYPLEEAGDYHDQRALAAFAHALPFANGSFDLVLDITAVSRYTGRHESHAGEEEEPIFRDYLEEALRVLKPDGILKIFDEEAYGWTAEPSWKEKVLINMGLKYGIIWEDKTGKKGPLGVEIRHGK